MFSPLGKLLCAAALAGTALAQTVAITYPSAGTTVTAGQAITVQVARDLPSSESATEFSLVIGYNQCSSPCSAGLGQALGKVLYNSPYNPQSVNGETAYQNISVVTPSYYNGATQVVAALFYATGVYATPELQFATLDLNAVSAQG